MLRAKENNSELSSIWLLFCKFQILLQAFQDEFDSRRSTLNTLQQTANPEDPTVLQQLNLLNDLWGKVEELSQKRELQLKDNLKTVSAQHLFS